MINPDVVAVQARKAAEQRAADSRVAVQGKPHGDDVVNLAGRRTAAELPGDARPLPTVDKYDELLRRTGSS